MASSAISSQKILSSQKKFIGNHSVWLSDLQLILILQYLESPKYKTPLLEKMSDKW